MALLIPVGDLNHETVRLEGELTAEELALDLNDPCIASRQPMRYQIVAELMGPEVLVQGDLEMRLDCTCVRCLEPFEFVLRLSPWSAMIPLSGEDALPLVDEAVDLTPQIREDSLLALPQHPVCRPECRGLSSQGLDSMKPQRSSDDLRREPSAWSVLDTLKLD